LGDRPETGDADKIDASPSLWVNRLASDEEDSEEEDEING